MKQQRAYGGLFQVGSTLSSLKASRFKQQFFRSPTAKLSLPCSTQLPGFRSMKQRRYDTSRPLSQLRWTDWILDLLAQVFRGEFGVHPDEAFDDFSRTPIASASIAQVHKARLKRKEGEPAWKDNEGWVAVKIR